MTESIVISADRCLVPDPGYKDVSVPGRIDSVRPNTVRKQLSPTSTPSSPLVVQWTLSLLRPSTPGGGSMLRPPTPGGGSSSRTELIQRPKVLPSAGALPAASAGYGIHVVLLRRVCSCVLLSCLSLIASSVNVEVEF